MERLRDTAIWANVIALLLGVIEVDGSTPAEQVWILAWTLIAAGAIGLVLVYLALRLIGRKESDDADREAKNF